MRRKDSYGLNGPRQTDFRAEEGPVSDFRTAVDGSPVQKVFTQHPWQHTLASRSMERP